MKTYEPLKSPERKKGLGQGCKIQATAAWLETTTWRHAIPTRHVWQPCWEAKKAHQTKSQSPFARLSSLRARPPEERED